MTRWLVDGMNVIGAGARGWWRDRPGAVRSLAADLARLAAQDNQPITVVFDGRGPPEGVEAPGVEVVFAPGGRGSADDEIVALLSADPAPKEILVFTSDRELAQRARATGAEVAGASALRKRLATLGYLA